MAVVLVVEQLKVGVGLCTWDVTYADAGMGCIRTDVQADIWKGACGVCVYIGSMGRWRGGGDGTGGGAA